MAKITPFLWFENQAEEATNYYVSLFKDGEILNMSRYPAGSPMPEGTLMSSTFKINGFEMSTLNTGMPMPFTDAVSFMVNVDGQDEVDALWDKIIADGGVESQCGWCKDKFGLSWQIIPKQLGECLGNPDPAKAQKAMGAMMQMKKIIVADLEKAVE